MKKAWYILNYHDISWEENIYTRGVGGTFPPDIFREHVRHLNNCADLMSVNDALSAIQNSRIDKPIVSFWFDDGLKGVRKYAFPILEKYNTKAALSVNSRFILRQEMFWRFKLSYLYFNDGSRILRSKLKKLGFKISPGFKIKNFVMDNFNDDILKAIDNLYNKLANKEDREDAFRIFDDVEGIQFLYRNGWEIANHSAAHYPVSEDTYIHKFKDQFIECENAIKKILNRQTDFWVLPFDRPGKLDPRVWEKFTEISDSRTLVYVGNRSNKEIHDRYIYRVSVPELTGEQLIKFLNKIN